MGADLESFPEIWQLAILFKLHWQLDKLALFLVIYVTHAPGLRIEVLFPEKHTSFVPLTANKFTHIPVVAPSRPFCSFVERNFDMNAKIKDKHFKCMQILPLPVPWRIRISGPSSIEEGRFYCKDSNINICRANTTFILGYDSAWYMIDNIGSRECLWWALWSSVDS